MHLNQFENTLSLFNNFVNEMLPDVADYWRPELSITDYEDRFVIECELPGVDQEHLSLDVHDGILEISGERHRQELPDGATVRVDERRWGAFRRRIRLDDSVNADLIEADYQDGILRITAPRQKESLPRKIEIRSASGSAAPKAKVVEASQS